MNTVRPIPEAGAPILDVERVRRDFPVLHQEVHGRPLVYLDNAATAQKPRAVIEAVDRFYRRDNANVHRGVHTLSQRATAAYEGARETVRRFLNAADPREIVFVRGATEGINLVAQSFVRPRLRPGDEILVTEMEHHANIVPWQMVCEATGARLRVVPIDERGALDLEAFHRLLGERTRFLAVVHVSNALGTINPVAEMVAAARARGIPTLVDGAQAVPHMAVDVQALGCDFYAFSGHKVFGPTGIGALYGRLEVLESMPPWQGGGDMIRVVTFERTEYHDVPHRFEAGTPHIAGAVGLAAAIEYLEGIGMERITAWEQTLLRHATARLAEVPGLRIIGTAPEKAAVISFVVEGIHAHDLGTILDHEGVAVRAGHHCTMPVMDHFGVPATARASFAFYNTLEEADRLVAALHRARELFGL
ncbi:cysteine desulfurase [Inmirania thermothiophila]|uniref:Cysteine desulfurase n=1 Tax=Inmirania thermothiophila TaxID=1750597 RepID=A0A3N1Y199_9GAMM|nr:cysteine desulfurase [Inmirania thermothiophila]ROR32596.1 cysteine desulfurase /L-selenocysteine selenide-lyase (L-alanine-forming) [Inmirania thermothiophila]